MDICLHMISVDQMMSFKMADEISRNLIALAVEMCDLLYTIYEILLPSRLSLWDYDPQEVACKKQYQTLAQIWWNTDQKFHN